MGKLYRVRNLRSPELAALFTGRALLHLVALRSRGFGTDELGYARKRLATQFVFPSLGWLLKWLGAYILIVGLVNFALLHRLGRREWGWVTVPLVALVFAAGLYAASAAKRPKSFGADELAVYWLDDRSPVAAEQIGLRVSSPRKTTVTLVVPGEPVLWGTRWGSGSAGFAFSSGVSVARTSAAQSWQVQLGPPRQLKLGLLQWSFRDLDFRAMKRFTGTMRRVGARQLRNETGQNFRDALYVEKQSVYFLGAVAAGAEISLDAVRQDALEKHVSRDVYPFGYPTQLSEPDEADLSRFGQTDPMQSQRELEEWRALPRQPFSLGELMRGWPKGGGRVFGTRTGIFFGLSDGPMSGAALARVGFVGKHYALTIVSFGREQ